MSNIDYTQKELITAYITCRFIEYHLYTEHKELQQRTQKIRDSIITYLSVDSCDYLLQFGEDLHNMKVKRLEQELFSKNRNKSVLSSKPSKSLEGYKNINVMNYQPINTNWIDTNEDIVVSLPMVITSTVMIIHINTKDSSGQYCITIKTNTYTKYEYAATIKEALFKATLIQLCTISYKHI